MRLLYVRNGLEDKTIEVSVNGGPAMKVKAIMRSWNIANVPVSFHVGDNSITVSYTGARGFNIDKIDLVR